MKKVWLFAAVLGLLFITTAAAFGQAQDAYTIDIRRDWGYGAGVDLQGRMTLTINGDTSEIIHVRYLLDGEEMAAVSSEPFSYPFNTDDFPAGMHTIHAELTSQQGEVFISNEITRNFVAASEVGGKMGSILWPIFGIAAVVTGLSFVLTSRRSKAAARAGGRDYGFLGGVICPKCGQPFKRSAWSLLHVGGFRFDRCPHCGRWVGVRRASQQQLEDAEAMFAQTPGMSPGISAEAQKKEDNLLDETRYSDL